MKLTDPGAIAERLGLPQEAVRRLQRRGFLRQLEFDDPEIRERLTRAHLGFVGRSDRATALDVPANESERPEGSHSLGGA